MFFTELLVISILFVISSALTCWEGIVRSNADGTEVSHLNEKHCPTFCLRTLIVNTNAFHYETFTCNTNDELQCNDKESYREAPGSEESVEKISWCCTTDLCNRDNTTFVEQKQTPPFESYREAPESEESVEKISWCCTTDLCNQDNTTFVEQKQTLFNRTETSLSILINVTAVDSYQIEDLLARIRVLEDEKSSTLWQRRKDVLLRNKDQLFYQKIIFDEALPQAYSAYAMTAFTFLMFCFFLISLILFLMVVSVILGLILLIIYYTTSLHHLNLFGSLSLGMWEQPPTF